MSLIYETVSQALKHRAALTPSDTALVEADVSYTWSDVDSMSNATARSLYGMGVRSGNKVGLWGINSFRWVFTFFALCKIGAVPVLINMCFQETELSAVFENAKIDFLLYGKAAKNIDYEKIIEKLDVSSFPELKKAVSFESENITEFCRKPPRFFRFISPCNVPEKIPPNDVRPEDCAVILYTSGTTGVQKGVMLSHVSLLNNARAQVYAMRWKSHDRICLCVPLMHCFGLTSCLLAAVYSGASLYIISYYKSEKVLAAIEQNACTVLNGVPSMFLALIHNKNFKNYRISSLKSGIIAGSPIGKRDYNRIRKKLHIDKLQTAYGQTETSPCVSIVPYDETENAVGSCGRVIEDVQVKIRHLDFTLDQQTAAGSRHGEILVKGYNVMQGYYNRAELTKKSFTEDGWLKTGDIGYMDKQGYLYITGRIKDIIIRGGENISPQEIENCIFELKGIKYAKVIGVPEKVIQEKIVACICTDNSDLTEDDVKRHILLHLAPYKVPEHVFFLQSMPFTASGKINSTQLKETVGILLKQQGNRT